MEKKELKVYEAPVMETVEMELQGILCLSTNADGVEGEEPGTVL